MVVRSGEKPQTETRKGNTMSTYTKAGDFHTIIRDSTSCATLTDYVVGALGDFADDYDVTAVEDAYRDAIDAAISPFGLTLAGDELLTEYGTTSQLEAAAEVVEAIDFWEIAAQHDTTDPK